MAKLYFRVQAEYDKVIKLREEIAKLKQELKGMDSTQSPAAFKALNTQLSASTQRMDELVTNAAKAGAVMEGDFKKKIFDASQSVNGFTEKIIAQKAVVKDIEADVKRLGEAYRTVLKNNPLSANGKLEEYNSARKALDKEKAALFGLTQEQANARLSVKKLRDEYALFKDDSKDNVDAISAIKDEIVNIGGKIFAGWSIKEFVGNIVKVRGEFQQLEVAFKTMLGSEDEAVKLMNQLVKTAATTPFDLQSVAGGAKQLLAYGLAAEDVNGTLIRLGDIAAGLSIPLGDLVYLYGTTRSQGRLYTQDLNQFTGRGIPMIGELAKQFNVAESEVKGLVEAGKIGFPEVQKVIESLTNEGGKFGGLMEAQSKTITGQISNIEDSISTMFNNIGKANEGIINDALSGVSFLVENYKEVGVILASIAASYGTYKAAIVAVNIAERVNIMLLRQAVVEKRLAAAANITLSNSMAIAAARGKMFALMQRNIMSSVKGAGAILSNPYVLLAAAVGSATYGLYKFYNRETEVERMQRQYNSAKEKAVKLEEEHKAKVDELVNSINDETAAQMNRVGAIQTLKQLYPGIIEKYIDEEGHLKNLISSSFPQLSIIPHDIKELYLLPIPYRYFLVS